MMMLKLGVKFLVDDGKLGLRVVAKDDVAREFEVEVENDGVIAKQKGVNIPNTKIPFPALADVITMTSALVLNKVSTSSRFHSYVLQKTLTKFVQSVKKLVTDTFNCSLKSKTNKVSTTWMKSSSC